MRRKVLKKKYQNLCKMLLGGAAVFGGMFANQHPVQALPVEPTTIDRANINSVLTSGDIMNITGTGNAFIRWNDFSIRPGETVNFSGMTNMLNYVGLQNPSLIYGTINAPDVKDFYVINPSGILFGPDSKVVTNNFYVSTRSLTENDISAYISGGTNPLDTAIDVSRINDGGLKSSDIMGAYDIADGDVMFLGQVQANSLTIEGNTIQIRNTANIKDKDGTAILEGDAVNLISNNPVEVGYEVDTENVTATLTNPFLFFNGESEKMTEDEFALAVADYYGIYLALHNGTLVTNTFDESTYNLPSQSVYNSNQSYSALKKLYTFYHTKIDELTTANATDKDKLIAAFAMDQLVRQNISTYGGQVYNFPIKDADGTEWKSYYYKVPTFSLNDDSTYSKYIEKFTENYNNIYGENRLSNPQYKYFIADSVGDENMPNSANNLAWKAYKLNGTTAQTIADYRLVNNADDLQYINSSRAKEEEQLFPIKQDYSNIVSVEGKIRGNYMLGADIDLSGKTFKPLGYGMTFYDYATESDLVNFNGLNFKIKGLTTDSDSAEVDHESIKNVGLFSVFSGTIKNLRLENFNVSSTDSQSGVGALIGTIGYNGGMALQESYEEGEWHWYTKNDQLTTTIKNVSLSGTNNISAQYSYSNVGGLVGSIGSPVYQPNKLTNSDYFLYNVHTYFPGAPNVIFENVENFSDNEDFSVVASADSYRTTGGGIVGAKISGNLSFKNSINFANVTSAEGSGGFLGKSLNLKTYQSTSEYPIVPAVDSKYNSISFEKVVNYGNIDSSLVSGGLFAQNDTYDSESKSYDSKISIKQSFNSGNITSDALSGGIVGSLNSPESIELDQIINIGNVTGGMMSGGLAGVIATFNDADTVTLKNSYNTGTVETGGYGGGIVAQLSGAKISNVYNSGKIKGQLVEHGYWDEENEEWVSSYNAMLGGLIGASESADNEISNSYNLGEVTDGAVTDGIVGENSAGTFTNVKSLSDDATLDVSEIYKTWSIDKDGSGTNKLWRVYADPDNPNDTTRQPLLMAFLNDATMQRYNELDEEGEVDPADLVTVENPITHTLHNSDGTVLETRYKNSGKTADAKTTASFVDYDVIESSEDGKFSVTGKKYFAEALMNSSQFGYNFQFDKNSNNDWKTSNDTSIKAAGTSATANTIYLKTDAVSSSKTIEIIIDVGDGEIKNNEFTALADDDDNYYTVSSTATDDDTKTIIEDLAGALKVVNEDDEGENTTVTIDTSKVTNFSAVTGKSNTYTVTKGGHTYEFTKTDDYTFTYVAYEGTDDEVTYTITIDPGKITTYTEQDAVITVSDGKVKGSTFTLDDSSKYSVDGEGETYIKNLLSGVLDVVQNGDGTGTALKFNSSVTINSQTDNADGTTTYKVTKSGTSYEFTKNTDGSYTYIDPTTKNTTNVKSYNVTVVPGTLTYEVTVTAGDATMTDNEITTITPTAGYSVTNDNKVTNTNGVITALLSGKLEIIETDDGLHTTLAAADSTKLTKSGNNYTYTDGANTYNFTKSGNVYTYEADNGVKYEVTVEQGDLNKIYNIGIQVSDGVYYINADGNNTLSLELVNGYKITKNADGSNFTDNFEVKYNDPVDETQITGPATTTVSVTNKNTNENYNTSDISASTGIYNSLTKNADGTYTISAIKDNVTYNINIKTGLVVSDTRVPVTINVADGKVTDGVFTGNGYDVSNNDIATLLQDKLTVVNDNGKTTVKFKDEVANLITTNADGSYTYNDGTNTYTFSKNTDGTYSYEVENTNGETIEYNVTIDTGDILTENNTDVKVTVNNGTVTNGNFTGNGYTVDNSFIGSLLEGNLQVIKTADDKTTVTVNNGDNLTQTGNNYTYTVGNTTYNFTKTGDNNYRYTVTNGNTTTNYNVQIVQGDISSTNTIPVTIDVSDGKIKDGVLTVVNNNGNNYTINNNNIANLLSGVLTVEKNSDGTGTTLKFNDGVTVTGTTQNSNGTTTYNVTKGGTAYQFTKNTDGSYTYTDNSDADNVLIYNVTVDPGSLTYEVKVEVGDVTKTDNVVTSGGGYTVSSDNGNIIQELLNGKLEVVETADGLNTTLAAKNASALTRSGNNYTYTDGANTYNFTKSGNVYTYEADNGVKYEVTVEQGDLNKIYNIGIQVSDGVYYINADGNNTLSLELVNGYKITKNADGSNFTDNFEVKYNDPVDETKITGPATTTVSVTNKNTNENYNTSDISVSTGVYNSLTKNADGTYTISAIKDNVTYNINIKTGLVVSDTRVPVTINVADGKVTDGVFTGNGYDVSNNDIATLLQDKLTVVNDNGKTTVKFKDEVANLITTNADGSYTYNDGTNTYTFSKNTDGTYSYEVENTNGETIEYNVTIDTGDILTENNTDVKVTVNNGTVTNGNFTGNGYTVDNSFIGSLLEGNLQVIKTADDKTTVTVNNGDNLTQTGNNYTYTVGNTTYNFTKTGDNNYRYTVTNGNTTTNYNVQIVQGDISSTNTIPVTIDVSDGKIKDGVLTVVNNNGNNYTINNNNIANLLSGVLTVEKNSDGTGTTLKFNDGVTVTGTTQNSNGTTTYNVTKGGTAYQFTKNTDGSYTYTDNSDADNVLIYNVTVDPGSLTYEVKVEVGDVTKTDNIVTSGGGYTVSSDNGNIIQELLNGKLEVVETADGLNTTLAAKNASALTRSGNNYTYTDGANTYNFTKSGNVYTYEADNGVKYEVTVEQGDLNKIYNIGIQVSDGVYYMNADGNNTLSLELVNGYKITKNADGSNFTDNFEVKYNDPVDETQITGPATTTVSVTNKNTNENYNTSDISVSTGVYNSLTKNADGTYTISAIKDNVTYNINIKTGLVVSDTKVPVTINVADGKVTDGVFTGNGYDVSNNDIATLLQDKLTVVNDNGKTTVKFKDEVANLITTNADGSYTYNDGTNTYTFSKNTDGTYSYEIENTNGETIEYNVTIDTGDILTENNTDVKVTVNNGTVTNGNFTGNGYTVDNSFIESLLEGNLQVIKTADDKTTVTVNNGENLTQMGNNYTYTVGNTTYNFTKTGDNNYRYTVTNGNTTTNYNVQIVQGDISSTNTIPVTIDVSDGKIKDGVLTVVNNNGNNYTINNNNIANLLSGVLTVEKNSDGTGTTLKFNDGVTVTGTTQNSNGTTTYNVTKGGTAYQFTKNTDGSYTYTDNSNADNVLIYNVTVDPGTLTYEVKVEVGDVTKTDNVVTSGGGYTVSSDNGNIIQELLNGKLEVVETADGLNTTLAAKNASALTRSGNNYTYTDGANIYNFTKSGNVYTYEADNGVKYEVTVEQGDLNKIYNIGIQVSDGVFYINAEGEGVLSLNSKNGYTITNNASGSKFTDDFNVSYNEPLSTPGDTTQVTGPYKTTVSITNTKDDNKTYTTNDFDIITGGYNQITANADGSYTIAPITNGNVTYNITIKPGEIIGDTTVPVTIYVNDGKITDGNFTDNGYTVTNSDIDKLLKDKIEVVNVDGKTTVKFKDEVSSHITDNGGGSYTYTDGTNTYTFTKNTDGTYSYEIVNPESGTIEYTVSIDEGNISTENNNKVKIKVNNGTVTDGVFTGNGYTVDNSFIGSLLEGNLQVIKTANDKTTVTVNNGDNLTQNGNNYTYTDGTNIYTFTKTGNNNYVYTINDGDTTTNYNVEVVEGGLQEVYNIEIQVSDGVYYMNADGNNTLSLDLTNGYKITKNADGSNFTDNFEIKYNDPADVTKITGPATTTVSVTNKNTNENYNTSDISETNGVYNSLNKNSDGSYTLSPITNGNITYNITIKPGLVVSDTRVPVTINVNDGTVTDGVFTDGGYTVTNTDIDNILKNKIEVVNVDGKTTIQFKDEVAGYITDNGGGSYTYNDGTNIYNFTKNTDDTYTYQITNPNNETIEYQVKINSGDVSTFTNTNVTIKVGDGTITDGVFSGGGYTVSNPIIETLIGKLTVNPTDDGNHTTVTLPTGENLVSNGDGTYTFTYTDGDDITTYIIKVQPGDISKYHNEGIVINVGDGKNDNGTFTNDGYTVDNENIRDLLDGIITVVTKDNEKATVDFVDKSSGVFTDNGNGTFVYRKDGVSYPFTKTGDNIYTFSIKGEDSTTIYTLTINPGNVENYYDKEVIINVGDGTLADGQFTNNGYTVDDDVIRGLLSGELTVTYNSTAKTTDVNFSNPNNLTVTSGSNYSYTKGGKTYSFTKNSDGTFKYVVENGNDTTTYKVIVNQGALTITNTETPSTPDTTPATPESTVTPSTPSTPSTPESNNTPSTPSTSESTYTPSTPSTSTFESTYTPSTPSTSTSEPTISTPEPTYTTTTPEVTETISTPENVDPLDTSEPTEIVSTPENVDLLDTSEPAEIVSTPENVESVPESAPTVEIETVTNDETIDYDLRGSQIEEFPEEKGDYVDLDSQDHILIETIDANEAIFDLDVVPEEFNEVASRNVVDNNNTGLTSINESPTESPVTSNMENSNVSNNLTGISSNRSNDNTTSTRNSGNGSFELNSITNSSTNNRAENSNSGGDTEISANNSNDSNSTTLSNNSSDELGNIETGRTDSSQEVNAEEQGTTNLSQDNNSEDSSTELSQDNNSEEQLSQDENSTSENEDDEEKESSDSDEEKIA